MNKKLLLSIMLFCLACLGEARATSVYVGSDWNSSNFSGVHPFNVSRNYSLTQQIYAYHEIGMAGTITSIGFMNLSDYSFSFPNLQVYMKTTEKEVFLNNNDMVPVSPSDKVFDGTFSGSGADWVTITLDTPFEYDGESNLLICFYDPDPGLDVSPRFQTVDIDYYRSICHCHDTEIPDLNNLYNYNGFKNFYKERNIIRFDITSNNSTSLTVYNGTATNYAVPAYIYYFDEFTRSQFVIPAADLADMAGSSISSMTFYTTFSDVPHTTECAADVYLKEVNYTEISAFEPKASATPVYSGTFSIESTSSGGKMTINFSTPYTYGGGNLLVGIENNEEDAWREIFFYGQNVIGASIAGSSSSSTGTIPATQQNFIPKTTFNYTPASGACQAPTYLKTNQLTYHYVDLEWESVQNNGYWVEYKQEGGEWIQKYASIGQGCSISGFNASTTYYVRVRAKCLNGEFGTWITRHFTTPPACNAPYNVHLERLTHSYAWIRWDIDQSFPTHDGHSFQYKQASSSEWINLCNSNHCGTDAILPDLDPATSYNFRVRANCTNEHESEWVYFNFTTLRTPVTVPFTEPFTNGILAYWNEYSGLMNNVLNGTTSLSTGTQWTTYTGNQANGVFDRHACLNIYGENVHNWLVTPLVEIQNNDYQLSFDLALTKFSGMMQPVTPGAQPDDKFAVLVSTDGGASWTILREWNNTGSEYVYDNIATTGETVQINLSDYYDPLYGYAYLRIAFYGESTVEQNNGDNNLHIDNVKIEEIDPCAAPYNVTILSTTQHGFDVSFTPGAVTQTVWYFNYTTTNTTPPTDAPGNTTHTSFGYSNLPNLNSNTTYYLWMGTYCEEENTYHWSEPAEFTTTEACSKVYAQDVVVEDTQPHSVTLSWEDYQGFASQWQIYYSYHDILPNSEEYINEVAYITGDPYVTIDNLYGDTDYHFWIRSFCGDWYGTPQWSSWSEMIDAHTLVSCPPPTNMVAHTTANSATIRWTPSDPSQNHWTVEITSEDWSDYPPYFEVDVPFITFNSDFLNGLVDDGNCYEKNYSVWVYTECGDPDGTSEAAAIDFIVTDKQYLTVYDGTTTDNHIPAFIYCFERYTRSQFVIPAEDLVEMLGTPITSMTFYTTSYNVPYTTVSDADVYLKEVDYSTISAYEPKSSATVVYSGRFDIVSTGDGGEMTINFSTPYTYNGGNLLMGVENTQTNGWEGINFKGQTVSGASISGSNTSSTGTIPATQQNFIPKTTFGFIPSCDPYPLPYYYGFEDEDEFACWTMLDCDGSSFIHGNAAHTGSNGFQFHWNTTPPQYLISPRFEGTTGMNVSFYYKNYSNFFDETFQVGYSTTIKSPNAFIWGDTITASGQTWTQYENYFPEGTKYVAVKLTSNDQYYLFLDDFSFEPAYCPPEDRCQLTFHLTDSYGDTWSNNAIKVIDVAMNTVLATMTNDYNNYQATGSQGAYTQTKTLSVCDGRELRFEWVKGQWPTECSFMVTDISGEVILQGSGSYNINTGDVLGTHTVDCTLKYIFLADGDWNDGDNWNTGDVPPKGRDVIIRADVTIPAGYTAVSNTVTLDGGSITVEDGGQLRHNTNNLLVTMKKNIIGYGDANSQNNFYLLAFPFTDDILVPAELTAEGCDLYMFDENCPGAEWRNHRQTPFNDLQMLDGYLFASPENFELEMTGPTMRSVTYHFPELPASVNPDNNFNGWYLLGNFYTSNAYIYTKNEDDEFVPMQVMVYNEEGELETRFAGPIPPMEGYFINLTEPTTVYFKSAPYIPTGAINGLFTVDADGDQVYFSKGNLQYIGSASTPYWKFADNQWEFLGDNGQNSTSPDVDRDLLGWGTSGYNHGAVCYQPWNTELPYDGYNYYAYGDWNYDLSDQTGQADWGYNAISNGGNTENSGWRTLTQSEWDYVFNTRTTSSGMRYVKASVNNVKGVILFPDDWKASYCTLNNVNTSDASFNSNTISESEWSGLEEHGAVFLPAAGHRAGNGMGYNMCCYWSSTHNQYAWAYYLEVFNSKLDTDAIVSRHYGHSVRLVRTVKK